MMHIAKISLFNIDLNTCLKTTVMIKKYKTLHKAHNNTLSNLKNKLY